jgi:TolB-like protein
LIDIDIDTDFAVFSLYPSPTMLKIAMKSYRFWLFLICLVLLRPAAPAQEKYYNYYSTGQDYQEKKDWLRAMQEFRSAMSFEFEDAARKRTYGTHFIEYFPHREMGVCHYYLGEMAEAKKELELSAAYESSERANEFLQLLRDKVPPSVALSREPKAPVEDRESRPAPAERSRTDENRTSSLPVGALTYDPSRVTQVGSRLGIAVLPIDAKGGLAKFADALTDKMVSQLVNLRRFKVIERTALDKVLKEQELQVSGVVDDATAVKVGRVAGADAIVLVNVVEHEASSRVSARVIDTETTEAIVARAEAVDGTAIDDYEHAVDNLAIAIYNELPIVEGFVIKVDKDSYFIDVGSQKGIRKGSKCVAFRAGENILHPTTGEVLGKRVTKLGELVVVQVQPKMAQVRVVDKDEEIKVGDQIVVK